MSHECQERSKCQRRHEPKKGGRERVGRRSDDIDDLDDLDDDVEKGDEDLDEAVEGEGDAVEDEGEDLDL